MGPLFDEAIAQRVRAASPRKERSARRRHTTTTDSRRKRLPKRHSRQAERPIPKGTPSEEHRGGQACWLPRPSQVL
jgi:hypothetical protein